MSDEASRPILSLRDTIYFKRNAFDNDEIGRAQFAKSLTSYLPHFSAGGVIVINGQWGDGKTWFGKNWEEQLRTECYDCAFIDAYERDYIDDPFIVISAALAKFLEPNTSVQKKFLSLAGGAAKTILPLSAQLLVNGVGHLAFGTANMSEHLTEAVKDVAQAAGDSTKEWLSERIEKSEKEHKAIVDFKLLLSDALGEKRKPCVIFIDELDRCRPDFAVRLLERVKHFFDVENLVFVLLINQAQLENALRGVYGSDLDASAYLNKFIDLSFSLPPTGTTAAKRYDVIKRYTQKACERFRFQNQPQLDQLLQFFSAIAEQLRFSLRECRRAVPLMAIGFTENRNVPAFFAWAIALKIKYPQLFHALRENVDGTAHAKALDLLKKFEVVRPSRRGLIEALSYYHQFNSDPTKQTEADKTEFLRYTQHSNYDIKDLFTGIASTIDVPVGEF